MREECWGVLFRIQLSVDVQIPAPFKGVDGSAVYIGNILRSRSMCVDHGQAATPSALCAACKDSFHYFEEPNLHFHAVMSSSSCGCDVGSP